MYLYIYLSMIVPSGQCSCDGVSCSPSPYVIVALRCKQTLPPDPPAFALTFRHTERGACPSAAASSPILKFCFSAARSCAGTNSHNGHIETRYETSPHSATELARQNQVSEVFSEDGHVTLEAHTLPIYEMCDELFLRLRDYPRVGSEIEALLAVINAARATPALELGHGDRNLS